MEIKEKKDFLVEDMYSMLSEAKEEIERRNADCELKKKVDDFVGGVPSVFKDKPKAIIFRNVATPNLEIRIAHEIAKILGLDLVVVEYISDKFCTRNRDKLHLGKMMFFDDNSKDQSIAKKNIISIKDDDNKCFKELKTLSGEDFVAFHHRIFKECGYGDVEFFDASIYKEMGLNAYEIYLRILGLCTCNAIFLENFLVKADKGEKKFTEEVIMPAFLEVKKRLGLDPLIVPILGIDGEGSVCWQHYSRDVLECINLKEEV